MNTINIAELLCNCPKGMKLYSPYVRNHFYDEMETEEYEHFSNIGAGSYLAERVMRYIQELLKEEK